MDQSDIDFSFKFIPPVGWALGNTVCLAAGSDNGSVNPGRFNEGFDYASYIHVVITLAENLLGWVQNVGWMMKGKQDVQNDVSVDPMHEIETEHVPSKMSFIDLLRPVYQQWHLTNLLEIIKIGAYSDGADTMPPNDVECLGKFELLDVVYFYSYMLRIFSVLNPMHGSLPVLNMLSFTPGFLVSVWGALESILFSGNGNVTAKSHRPCISKNSGKAKDEGFVKKQKGETKDNKDGVNKWVNVLNKVTGKSQAGIDLNDSHPRASQVEEDSWDLWNVEPLRCGPQGISKDLACLLHLFCASYSHLLLILDDIEFYEKEVNFFSLLWDCLAFV